MQVDYIARRSIQAGHTVETQYTINFDIFEKTKTSKAEGVQVKSLSGNTVTVVHRNSETYNLTSVLITASTTTTLLDMREFLDSVTRGETFFLDVRGTSEAYILSSLSNPYTETELETSHYRFSFGARRL